MEMYSILCLDAILNQGISIDNYEIIIVDDCSTDETEMNCIQLANTQKNIIYIRNKTNQGLRSGQRSLSPARDNSYLGHRVIRK